MSAEDLQTRGSPGSPADSAAVSPTAAQDRELLESGRRFSECLLWDMQRRFFEERGIAAWRSGVVPEYITSHPFLAEAYARIAIDWLREVHAAPEYNPDLPVRIFELAAGSGRFGFYFLRAFSKVLRIEQQCRPDFFMRPGSVRYIMSDLVKANVEFWRGHKKFEPFLEAGLLDFQCLDLDWNPEEPDRESPEAAHEKSSVARGNPVALIANYCFDSLRNDVFLVRGGRLFEGRVDVFRSPDTSPLNETEDTHAPAAGDGTASKVDAAAFARLELEYDYHEVADISNYYREPEFNELLARYRESLADTVFAFPVGALAVLRKFAQLADGRLLLLSADKGFAREADLLQNTEPDLVLHGCFSLMVNYHAIRQYCELPGGSFTQSAEPDASLKLVTALWGFENSPAKFRVAAAADEYLGRLNPEDLYMMRKNLAAGDALSTQYPEGPEGAVARFAGLPGIFARLRFGGYDSEILFAVYHRLRELLPAASAGQKREALRIAREIWENYFSIGESRDLAFHLGVLLHEIEYYQEALWFFERSRESQPPDANTLYNLAVCCYELRDFERGLDFVAETLRLDPDQPAARALRIKLEAEAHNFGA
ncbi:MAG: tetratricopeptide repeat protein [bacterium]|nr:tetratricopeptide repeat protein [bacterium]